MLRTSRIGTPPLSSGNRQGLDILGPVGHVGSHRLSHPEQGGPYTPAWSEGHWLSRGVLPKRLTMSTLTPPTPGLGDKKT